MSIPYFFGAAAGGFLLMTAVNFFSSIPDNITIVARDF